MPGNKRLWVFKILSKRRVILCATSEPGKKTGPLPSPPAFSGYSDPGHSAAISQAQCHHR